MKTILLMLFILPVFCQAQSRKLPVDSNTHKVTYHETVKVDGVNKNKLYARARNWFALTFQTSRDVIQTEDQSAGEIIGTGSDDGVTNLHMVPIYYWLNYMVFITVEDGLYKYAIANFVIEKKPSQYSPTVVPTTAEVFYNTIESKTDYLAKNSDPQLLPIYNTYTEKIDSVATGLASSLKDAMFGKAVKPKGTLKRK